MALLEGLGPGLLRGIVERLTAAYPAGLHGTDASALTLTIHEFAARAYERYGVHSSRDIVRMVGIAVRRGWDFDEGAQGAWVRTILGDQRVPTVSRRVERLLAESRRRENIEARNRAIDERLGSRPG